MKLTRLLNFWLLVDSLSWLSSSCAQEFDLDDLAIQEALGSELMDEDCSIFGGQDCQDQALLQTKALYNKAKEDLVLSPTVRDAVTDDAKTDNIESVLSFFQMGEEVHSSSVGEVRINGSWVREFNSSVGEVHSQTNATQEVSSVAVTSDEAGAALAPRLSEASHSDQASLRAKWQAAAFDVFPGHYSEQHTGKVDRSSPSLSQGQHSEPVKEQPSITDLFFGHPLASLAMLTLAFVLAAVFGWTVGMAILAWRGSARSRPTVKASAPSEPCDAQLPSVETEASDVLSAPPTHVMKGFGRSLPPSSQAVADDDIVWCTAENLEELLPTVGGYDCDFAKPRSTGKPVRLKVRIEGPLPGGPGPLGLVKAPLTQQNCVHYAANTKQVRGRDDAILNRQEKNGVDFQVSLLGAPHVTIDVLSHEVELTGQHDTSTTTMYQSFETAPGACQDFLLQALAERSPAKNPKTHKEELRGVVFEFQERVLLVGSQVAIVGELVRDASGHIFIQPWRCSSRRAEESWRTSWERPDSLAHNSVLVSYL